MKINTKFPMAVHILALLAMKDEMGEDCGCMQEEEREGGRGDCGCHSSGNEGCSCTSEMLAKSIGTNPVVVRRLISSLKEAGLVNCRPGVAGSSLGRDASQITLLDVYRAVRGQEDGMVLDVHTKACPRCPVGKNITAALEEPFARAQEAMEEKLREYTLSDIAFSIEEKRKK